MNENYRNRNLYRDKINGDELFKLKDICELLVADYKQVMKAMNNEFVSYLCNKNVILWTSPTKLFLDSRDNSPAA